MSTDRWQEVKDSIINQFGLEIEAGVYDEKYPSLKQLWLEDTAARAEQFALRQACDEVAQNYREWKD